MDVWEGGDGREKGGAEFSGADEEDFCGGHCRWSVVTCNLKRVPDGVACLSVHR